MARIKVLHLKNKKTGQRITLTKRVGTKNKRFNPRTLAKRSRSTQTRRTG